MEVSEEIHYSKIKTTSPQMLLVLIRFWFKNDRDLEGIIGSLLFASESPHSES